MTRLAFERAVAALVNPVQQIQAAMWLDADGGFHFIRVCRDTATGNWRHYWADEDNVEHVDVVPFEELPESVQQRLAMMLTAPEGTYINRYARSMGDGMYWFYFYGDDYHAPQV
jgi:hypothetical protein